MELIASIILYGLAWGAYHFRGYSKTIQKVMANPEEYSKFTIALCKKLTFPPKILVSFITLTALLVPILAIGIMIVASYMWSSIHVILFPQQFNPRDGQQPACDFRRSVIFNHIPCVEM